MKHKINPQVDCVFKAILGAEENKLSLIDFLNSVLDPTQAVSEVEILNPYNEKEFLSDKLTIVDIKAKDAAGRQFQIEIQIASYGYLPQRMLYLWSDIYGAQLKSGEGYHELTPVISIWLLVDNLFKQSEVHHHHFQMLDARHQQLLTDQCSIHVLELNKWQKSATLKQQDHWFYFFKEAQYWTDLPDELDTPTMRRAMKVLETFSEKEYQYHLYQARENALRDEVSKQYSLEQANRLKDQALLLKDQALLLKDQALAREAQAQKEKEALIEQLRAAGIEPKL